MGQTDFNAKAQDWDENPMRVERANVIARAILQQIKFKPDSRALEYGCGTGLLSFALQSHLGRITLADSASGMLEVLRRKIEHCGVANMTPLRLDLLSDPLPSERFDLIYSLMTLHHIGNEKVVLQAFFDLLVPGGQLCIADLDQEDGSFHDEPFDGHHGFDREDLTGWLRGLGFIEIHFSTPYIIHKVNQGKQRDYPVFLATCSRPDQVE